MGRPWTVYLPEFWEATRQTLFMASAAGALVIVVGLTVGTVVYLTAPGSVAPNVFVYYPLSLVVNLGRSIPFIILIVLLVPFTRFVVGTMIGEQAALVPLAVGFAPFFARLVESTLRELDQGRIEAARATGATKIQIVFRVLLPESLSGIIASATIVLVGLVEGTAVAGAIGAGGLGDFALRYGYQRYITELMILSVVAMVVIVQTVQLCGDAWVRARRHKR